MYREHRQQLLTWMLNKGRAPDMNVGYAEETVENRSDRLDMFYRWAWDVEGGYTENITISHANALVKYLQPQSYSQVHRAAYQKAIHNLFDWQRHALNRDVEWKPTLQFYDSAVPSSVEPLTHDERQSLREAVLDHESVPHYNSLTPKQRDQWKSYLAQRFQKLKPEVTKEDFERANRWRWPSLICTSLDAGLRPKEVSRAKVSWVDINKALLRIPTEDAVKNNEHWNVGLKQRTATLLENWIEERETYEKYDDSELLWLTKYSNPYGSQALNRRFQKLCDEARIDRGNRKLVWYSIRYSVGREMLKELGVGAAVAQLPHQSMNSTLRYIRPSAEERQDALDKMG